MDTMIIQKQNGEQEFLFLQILGINSIDYQINLMQIIKFLLEMDTDVFLDHKIVVLSLMMITRLNTKILLLRILRSLNGSNFFTPWILKFLIVTTSLLLSCHKVILTHGPR